MTQASLRQFSATRLSNVDLGGGTVQENQMYPSGVNNAFRELMGQIAENITEMSYPTAGGTADALTLTPTTALAALANNVVYTATIATTNATTTPTLAVSGLTAKVIRKIVGGTDVAVAAGDMSAGQPTIFVYSTAANSAGGAWIVVNPKAAAATDLGLTIDALTAKTTPVDADELAVSDSAAANVGKKVTGTNFKAYLKTYFDTLYQPLKTILTTLGALANASGVLTNNGSGSLSWAAAAAAGIPIPSGAPGTWAVGSIALAACSASVAVGGTTAGSNLSVAHFTTAPAVTASGVTCAGTWQNIGTTTTSSSAFVTWFVRTA